MRLPEEMLGQEARCPGCGCVFTPGPKTPVSAGESGRSPAPITAITEPSPLRPSPAPNASAEPEEEERPWERTQRRRTRRDSEPHRGPIILVLGITSLVMAFLCGLGLPFGVAAWVMGYRDLRKMRYEKSMDPEGEGMTQAGMVCGAIGSFIAALCVMGAIAYCFFMYFVFTSVMANISTNPAFTSARMRPAPASTLPAVAAPPVSDTAPPAPAVPPPAPVAPPAPQPEDKDKQ
jgi:hypothetical protein